MSSSDGGEQQQHDEHHVAVAAALQRARDAVAALVAEPPSKFLEGMRSALQQAEAALQQQPRGRWAWTLPNRTRHLASMLADDPRRPAREEAYAAMANLKAVAFAAASSTDRSRKSIINKRQKTVDDAAAAEHEPMLGANAPGACRFLHALLGVHCTNCCTTFPTPGARCTNCCTTFSTPGGRCTNCCTTSTRPGLVLTMSPLYLSSAQAAQLGRLAPPSPWRAP